MTRVNQLSEIVRNALAEDIGPGDLTTSFFIDAQAEFRAVIISKEACVLAGMQAAVETFRQVDDTLEILECRADGDVIAAIEPVLAVSGSARSILTAERTALNFLQQLSGIATVTRRFVDAVDGSGVEILDTRKTTPGLRFLEKAAVSAGGGRNHRMGLYDAVMLKDNHLPLAGGIEAIEKKIKSFRETHPNVHIEVEADTVEQVQRLLLIEEIDVILLDNMSIEAMAQCVDMRGDKRVRLEASGGINLGNIVQVAATGVDRISIGVLTHSARAIDLSLEIAIPEE
jgi:nicotinate-nucleotide pyrophosphorylase (carboxylating)